MKYHNRNASSGPLFLPKQIMKTKNFLLLLLSIFLTLILLEIFLIFSKSYNHVVTNNLIRSNTIWTNQENSQIFYMHPDLNYPVQNNYRKFGVKANFKIDKDFSYWGFFGDSMTDNRRIDYEYNFSSFFNEIYSNDISLNFGVDGFGLDQSYFRYLNVKDHFKLSKIFYVFVPNDFPNILQTELFRLDDKEELVEFKHKRNLKNNFFFILGKLRLTYLTLSFYHKIIAKNSDLNYLKERIIEEYVIDEKKYYESWKPRFFSINDSIIWNDFLSLSPTKPTVQAKKVFNLVLAKWLDITKSQGHEFYIILLPNTEIFFEKLIDNKDTYNVINFKERFSNMNYTLEEGHWNEVGNLTGALDLADYFKINYSNSFVEGKLEKIKKLYKYNKCEAKLYKTNTIRKCD